MWTLVPATSQVPFLTAVQYHEVQALGRSELGSGRRFGNWRLRCRKLLTELSPIEMVAGSSHSSLASHRAQAALFSRGLPGGETQA